MSRRAASFALQEEDIPVLERMKSDADQTQAQIAAILLACNEEPQITKVAEHLHVHKNTVNRWRSAYLEGGLDAVFPKKAGRPPADQELIDQVQELLESTGDLVRWTAADLSISLGVPEQKIRKILNHLGITLERSHLFKVPTSQTLTGNGRYLVGTYLSPDAQIMVFATYTPIPDDPDDNTSGSDGVGTAADSSAPDGDNTDDDSNTPDGDGNAADSGTPDGGDAPDGGVSPDGDGLSTDTAIPDGGDAPDDDHSVAVVPEQDDVDPAREQEIATAIAKQNPLCLVEGSIAVGQVLTVDRKLKDILLQSASALSLEDALYTATTQERRNGDKRGLTPGEYLQKTISLWADVRHVHLDVFCCGASVAKSLGRAWKFTTVHQSADFHSWRAQVIEFKWSDEPDRFLGSYANLSIISQYVEAVQPGDTPFCWQMLPYASGISDGEVSKWSAPILNPAYESETLEEAMTRMINDLDASGGDGETATTVKVLLMSKGEDGLLKYHVITDSANIR